MSTTQHLKTVYYHQGGFPPNERLDWRQLAPTLTQTALALGHYANTLGTVPNARVLLSLLTRMEAERSSRIEGTMATVEDVLRYETGEKPASPQLEEDVREVINYQLALVQGQELLIGQQLSQEIMLKIHRKLLSGTRGRDKNPGALRATQNWIVNSGNTNLDAIYEPVSYSRLHETLDNWLDFTLNDETSPLLKVALTHAEFEAIHPFSDGNGRLGRILVPLQMWQSGLIPEPLFNIGVRLEVVKDEYYERLLAVSRDDDWTGWCVFFLKAVEAQAREDLAPMQKTKDLYDSMIRQIDEVRRSKYGIQLLDGIFNRPYFTIRLLAADTDTPEWATRRIVEKMVESDTLVELHPGKGRTPSRYLFTGLWDIIRKGRAALE